MLGIATVVAYIPALQAGFVYDDSRFVTDNPSIRDLGRVVSFFTDQSAMTADFDRDIYRPLRTLAFALDWALVEGEPFLYHAMSLAWHLACVVLLWHLLRRALGVAERWVFLGTGLFALHPVATEAVAWISSRGDLMAAAFSLAALHVALHKGEGLRSWRSSVARLATLASLTALAMLAKESGAGLVFAIAGSSLLVTGKAARERVADVAVVTAVTVLYLVARTLVTRAIILSQLDVSAVPFADRLAWNLQALLVNLRLVVLPVRLTVDYSAGAITAPTGWSSLLSLAAIALLAGFGLHLLRRSPLPLLGLMLAASALVPTSHAIFGVKALVAERFLYVPLAGAAIFVTGTVQALVTRRGTRDAVFVLAVLVLGVFAVLTFLRCRDWRSQETLWRSVLRVREDSIDARLALGSEAHARGDRETASRLWQEVVERTPAGDPRHLGARFCLARAAYAAGEIEEAGRALEAIHREARQRYRRLNLGWYPEAMLLFGDALRRLGLHGPAVALFRELIAELGRRADFLHGLGMNLDLLGRAGEAEAALQEAVRIDPESAWRHEALGTFYRRHGRFAEARRAFEEALGIDPHDARARVGLRKVEERSTE
ncbi:MAG: tetratricopeptide repeat protein [Planctomycetota bacterium]